MGVSSHGSFVGLGCVLSVGLRNSDFQNVYR